MSLKTWSLLTQCLVIIISIVLMLFISIVFGYVTLYQTYEKIYSIVFLLLTSLSKILFRFHHEVANQDYLFLWPSMILLCICSIVSLTSHLFLNIWVASRIRILLQRTQVCKCYFSVLILGPWGIRSGIIELNENSMLIFVFRNPHIVFTKARPADI